MSEPTNWPSLELQALTGRTVDLVRTDLVRHGDGLWAAIGAQPELWDAIPSGPFEDRAAFDAWLGERVDLQAIVLLTVMDKAADRPAGLLFLLRGDPAAGRTEIGLVYGGAISRRAGGTEAVFLLLSHVFDACSYRRLEWRCRPDNLASRRAAERFGFAFEGVLRENLWVKGSPWDTAVYSMLRDEWPAAGNRLSAWLAPDNFDEKGRQKRPLAEF